MKQRGWPPFENTFVDQTPPTICMVVGFGLGYAPDMSVGDMARHVSAAERRGYDMGFFSETLNLLRDGITTLSAFVLSTKRMRVGATQIVRLRSPVTMAQTIATLDELSEGRTVFALGACTSSHAKRHGLEPQDPATSLREYFQVIRMLLAGGPVSFEGESVRLEEVGLSFQPKRSRVKLWVASTSRTGLQIAGAIGDGVLLNAITSPEYSRNAVSIVRKSAEEAGRNPNEIEVAQLIVSAVSKSHEESMDSVRYEVANKFTPWQAPFNVWPKIRVGEPAIKQEDLPRFSEAYREGGYEKLMSVMPESYLVGMTASGTREEALGRLEQYRRAGVSLPIVRPATTGMLEPVLETFATK